MAESAASAVITGATGSPESPTRDPSDDTPGAFRLTVVDTPDGTVVALTGELDLATAPILDDCFRTLTAPASAARLVVDTAELSFCGCAGLGVLLRARRRAMDEGGWLRICGATPSFHRILRITRLSEALPCYPSAADAFAGSSPPRP